MRSAFLLLLLSLTPLFAGPDTVVPEVEVRTPNGVLYRYGERRVLVVSGSPMQRGLAHGRLLKAEIKSNIQAFLYDWGLGRRGKKREEFRAIWNSISTHIPAHYHAELAGLAEGSGLPLADLQLLHAIPSRFHCTGTAAMPEVTRDGKVYHTRSLDYSLDIGDTVRPQTNSLLLVTVPDEGVAHATVGWAGFLGCVTGLNVEGVSVGEMGSSSKDESYDGFPMIFLLREVLYRCKNLEEAKQLWTRTPRTCGYNFIFCDPGGITAVECNRSRIRFFGPGDEAENVAPHFAIRGVVRRCNHFVDKELAATQRDVYDPRKSQPSSWSGYDVQGGILKNDLGAIDASTMIELLRSYPPVHPCLHQAVMCPTDRSIWVSQAKDPAHDPLPGAQNQAFLRYDLPALVKGEPSPAQRAGPSEVDDGTIETGQVRGERAIEGVFAHEPKVFDWRLEYLRNLGDVSIHHLTYPSPGPSRFPINLTVHAEYYRPEGKGPFPAAVVLHISDGRFYVARLLAASLARRGVASLFIQLPYYGDRRPEVKVDPNEVALEDAVGVIKQAVHDIRRGAAWLRERPEVNSERVGLVGASLGSFAGQMAAGADGGFDRCAFLLGGGSLLAPLYSRARETRKVLAYLEGRGLTREKVEAAIGPLEPIRHVDGLKDTRILMINCDADPVVPPESTRTYWEALGKPEIHWYKGDHYAIKNHVIEVLSRVTGHFVGG